MSGPLFTDIHVQILQDGGPDSAALLDQTEKNMLGADVFVIESLGLLIGQRHYLACTVCKTLKHL